jgi:hypothetical protein
MLAKVLEEEPPAVTTVAQDESSQDGEVPPLYFNSLSAVSHELVNPVRQRIC